MAQPRVLILRAPGTNCDLETAHAFERAGARCERLHVNRLLESPQTIAQFQIMCLPGGFSYGDDLAAGRILGSQLRQHLAGTMRDFREAGKLILGICNGFQILLKSGLLLPDDPQHGPPATLAWNAQGASKTAGSGCARPAHRRFSSPASTGCICRSPMPKGASCRAAARCLISWKKIARWCCAIPRLRTRRNRCDTFRRQGGPAR